MTNELTADQRIELLKLAERLTKDYEAEVETLGQRLSSFEVAYQELVQLALASAGNESRTGDDDDTSTDQPSSESNNL